jgi:hypothetical protein
MTKDDIQHRLANANDYFLRKASEVYGDDGAMALLETMYGKVVIDISDFDPGADGLALAKLTAANFCEIGAKVIYITEAGQLFIESLREDGATQGHT